MEGNVTGNTRATTVPEGSGESCPTHLTSPESQRERRVWDVRFFLRATIGTLVTGVSRWEKQLLRSESQRLSGKHTAIAEA